MASAFFNLFKKTYSFLFQADKPLIQKPKQASLYAVIKHKKGLDAYASRPFKRQANSSNSIATITSVHQY